MPRAARDHHLSHARFLPRQNKMLPGFVPACSNMTYSPSSRDVLIASRSRSCRAAGRAGHESARIPRLQPRRRTATPARLSPTIRSFAPGCSRIRGAHGEAIANGAIKGRIIAVGDECFRRACGPGRAQDRRANSIVSVLRRAPAGRSCGDTSMTFARASSTESMAAQSQEASLVPVGTIVASRSGPVEIMPISSSSWSEMKFR